MAKKSKIENSPIENRGDMPVTLDELCQALGVAVAICRRRCVLPIEDDATLYSDLMKAVLDERSSFTEQDILELKRKSKPIVWPSVRGVADGSVDIVSGL